MNSEQIQSFKVTIDQQARLDREFTLLLEDCHLGSMRESGARRPIEAVSGCYVWVMRVQLARYFVYVGRTHSIRRRVTDYSGAFQIHSPNDFKLRFFEEEMREAFPSATFELYFSPTPLDVCTEKERELIIAFVPLINTLPPPNAVERKLIESAYRAYYRSIVERRLGHDP